MHVLVTGGTGALGTVVVWQLLARGDVVRVMSRRPAPAGTPVSWATADIATGAGVAEAVSGVDAVIHAASDPEGAANLEVSGTRRLAEEARGAGVSHFIYVSIVGIDRIPYAYYRRKLAAEQAVAGSHVPYSVLRATQFHSFIDFLLRRAARYPAILPLPAGFHVQSVAIDDVAARLCDIVADRPGALLPDFAGPEPMTVVNAARAWKSARGVRKPIVPIWIPGRVARAFRQGYNTNPAAPNGTVTWRSWLETQTSSSTEAP